MSLRSYIAMKTEEGYKCIYCHDGGLPNHNSKILKNHYQDIKKVKRLIELGDLSCLDENIGKRISFKSSEKRRENKQCLAYHRDRRDSLVIKTFKTKEDLIDDCYHIEYIYIFENGSWHAYDPRGFEIIIKD